MSPDKPVPDHLETLPQVARVPDLHLIDAVLSHEEKSLLAKDGLDSCALR